jgi:hypothetical protein
MEKFNGVIPDRMSGQSLRILFAKYFDVVVIFRWDFHHGVFDRLQWAFCGLNDGPSNVEALLVFLLLASWEECGSLSIRASKDDGELHVIEPSPFSVDIRLYCHEPGIP